MTIDIEGAHPTDPFTAVVIEDHGLLALTDELLIEYIHHLEEGASLRDIM